MPDSINLDKIREALYLIDAPGHLILDNDKKPLHPASWKEPSSWLRLDDALAAYANYGELARGVAVIASYQLFIFDFDPLTDAHVEEAAKYNLTREYVENTRESIRRECLDHTYVENSHARGIHGVFLSSRSFVGRVGIKRLKTCFAIDVIHGNKYCHITADRINERNPIDYTDRIDVLLLEIERLCPARPAQNALPHDEYGNIGVDWLENAEVAAVLECQRPATYATINNDGPCHFSQEAMKAVGDLAKITSDAGQAYRMLSRSPLITSSIRCEGGTRDRWEKFEKRFPRWWEQARESNVAGVPLITRHDMGRLPSIEHGTRVFEQIMACRSALPPAPPATDSIVRNNALSTRRSFDDIMEGEDVDTTELDSTPRMCIEPPIGRKARLLYEDIMRRQHYPNPTIAWIATTALLAAIGHRSAFVEGDISISQAIMLLSVTTDGKQVVPDTLADYQTLVRETPGNDSGQYATFLNSFAAGEFASQAAIGDKLQKTPRITAVITEGDYLLGAPGTLTTHEANAMHEMMRIRTSCGFGQNLPGRAYATGGRGADRPTIECPSLNVVADSQPKVLYGRVQSHSAEKGTLNRWMIVDASRPWKGRRNPDRLRGFSPEVQKDLLALTDRVVSIEHLYSEQPKEAVNIKLSFDAINVCTRFERKFLDGLTHDKDSMEFAIFGRTLVAAKALAGVFALYENPNEPIIEGALMRSILKVLWEERDDLYTKFKEGEIGQGDHQRLSLLVKALRSAYPASKSRHLSTKAKDAGLVPRAWLDDQLSGYVAFRQDGFKQKTALLHETIYAACANGVLIALEKSEEKYGLKGTVYRIDVEALRNF